MVHGISDEELRKYYSNLLYQATFGPRGDDLEWLESNGAEVWLEKQFNIRPSYHLPKLQEFSELAGEPFIENLRIGAWWQRAIQAEDQLRQRMAYALSQIFVISKHGVGNKTGELAKYYDILVKHAFGNFRDLLEEVTLNPLMGKYLSLEGSKKENRDKNTFPDENYAREVMQLFTIGLWQLKDNGEPKLSAEGYTISAYTQTDVEELARALTGWKKTDYYVPMYVKPDVHDDEEKRILGEVFPASQGAEADMKQALTLLFEHENTPPFIAALLIKRLVTSNPRRQYVERVARVFKDNGEGVRGDLKATLVAIFTDADVVGQRGHSAGLGRRATFGLVKEPVIAIANQARALDMVPVGNCWWDYPKAAINLGQAPLQAPSVFNFYSPDYSPQGEFSNTGLMSPETYLLTPDVMRRIHNALWMNVLADNNTNDKQWVWDSSEFEALEGDPDAFVALMDTRIFSGYMSDELGAYIKDMLVNQIPEGRVRSRTLNPLYVAFTSPEFFCQEA